MVPALNIVHDRVAGRGIDVVRPDIRKRTDLEKKDHGSRNKNVFKPRKQKIRN